MRRKNDRPFPSGLVCASRLWKRNRKLRVHAQVWGGRNPQHNGAETRRGNQAEQPTGELRLARFFSALSSEAVSRLPAADRR